MLLPIVFGNEILILFRVKLGVNNSALYKASTGKSMGRVEVTSNLHLFIEVLFLSHLVVK